MIETMPMQTSDLVPLSTRLLPKEISYAFDIADDTYDTQHAPTHAPTPSATAPGAAASTVPGSAAVQACVHTGGQPKQKGSEQQQARQGPSASLPAANAQKPAASVTQPLSGAISQPAPAQTSSLVQGQSMSQQQVTSSISAGLQPALQTTAAVVGGQLRGFPAAYISPHTLLPYGQQAMAALPHLSGAVPLAMYSPADLTAMMALQQQQQQQQHDESVDDQQARALKRPRLVWTPALHKKFEEAVQKIGVNKAVPKTIMQMMDVEGLTRENVASHLQKYRMSLKKGPDGEFVTTITEGTDMSVPDAAAGSTGAPAAAAAATAATTADAGVGGSSEEAGGDSAGGGAVAGSSRGEGGTEAASTEQVVTGAAAADTAAAPEPVGAAAAAAAAAAAMT